MTLNKLLNNVSTLAIVCNQFGDTGKGKFVDFFADWADIIARGTGGANAGHTIKIKDKEYVFHLVPSGITYDSAKKSNIIGSGVVFDPKIFLDEIHMLETEKLTYNHLLVSLNAKLVLPQHIALDNANESGTGTRIGTTGRGIGPAYTDFTARKGLIANDLLNKDIFARKLRRNLEDHVGALRSKDPETVKKIISKINNGIFYSEKSLLDPDAIIEKYTEYGRIIRDMISDTDTLMQKSLGKKHILLEGAQGILLSVDYGNYPFVTSSDASVRGLAKGTGLSERDIDLTLGIVKAFYMTRVGEGPFPTEFSGELGDYVRSVGNEFGATTGRPRRVGWLDLPLLRYATKVNGRNIILTKLDVLDECDTIEICYAYQYTGETFNYGGTKILNGSFLSTAIVATEVLEKCRPINYSFDGWKCDISHIRDDEQLPAELRNIIGFIENVAGVCTRIISVGPERDQTIIMP
jgi:adenylosuccinate synthase